MDKQLPITLKAVDGMIIENYIIHWDIVGSMIFSKIVPSSDKLGVDVQFIEMAKLLNIPGKNNIMAAQYILRVLPNPLKPHSEIIILTRNTMMADTDGYVHLVKMHSKGLTRDENPRRLLNFSDLAITNEGTLLGA